jgi:poly-gamma-glutamate system protein
MIRRHKLTPIEIQCLGLTGAVFLMFSIWSLRMVPAQYIDLKLQAAKKTEYAFDAVKQLRIEKQIYIDSINDPMGYGLIGDEFTMITTERGDLGAKLTSANPNWSAYIIEQLIRTRVRNGDVVAISMTGSFPALNIATIIAVETYGAIPVWVASEGSSSWGANIPGLTWSVIENHLFSSNIIGTKAVGVSIGGGNNTGSGLTEEGRSFMQKEISTKNANIINQTPLGSSIEKTMEILERAAKGKKIKLFINIGGGIVSFGTAQTAEKLASGFNSPRMMLSLRDQAVEGLVMLFMRKGIPVVNLEKINVLAEKVKFPVSPGVLPSSGTGYLFEHKKYPVIAHIVVLLLFLAIVTSVTFGVFSKNKPKKDMV